MGKLGKNKNLASDQTKPLSFGKATGIINKEKSLATFRDVLFIKELSVGLIKSRLWVKNMLVWVESITADRPTMSRKQWGHQSDAQESICYDSNYCSDFKWMNHTMW